MFGLINVFNSYETPNFWDMNFVRHQNVLILKLGLGSLGNFA